MARYTIGAILSFFLAAQALAQPLIRETGTNRPLGNGIMSPKDTFYADNTLNANPPAPTLTVFQAAHPDDKQISGILLAQAERIQPFNPPLGQSRKPVAEKQTTATASSASRSATGGHRGPFNTPVDKNTASRTVKQPITISNQQPENPAEKHSTSVAMPAKQQPVPQIGANTAESEATPKTQKQAIHTENVTPAFSEQTSLPEKQAAKQETETAIVSTPAVSEPEKQNYQEKLPASQHPVSVSPPSKPHPLPEAKANTAESEATPETQKQAIQTENVTPAFSEQTSLPEKQPVKQDTEVGIKPYKPEKPAATSEQATVAATPEPEKQSYPTEKTAHLPTSVIAPSSENQKNPSGKTETPLAQAERAHDPAMAKTLALAQQGNPQAQIEIASYYADQKNYVESYMWMILAAQDRSTWAEIRRIGGHIRPQMTQKEIEEAIQKAQAIKSNLLINRTKPAR